MNPHYLDDILPPPDSIRLEIGPGLIALVCETGLIRHVSELRRVIEQEYGLSVPSIRVIDNAALDTRAYLVRIYGVEVARGTLPEGERATVILKHLSKVIRENADKLTARQSL